MSTALHDQPAKDAGRVLWTSTAAFGVCFAVWTIFSIVGLGVKGELGLSETEFGLLVGTPILTGSVTRVFFGIWADRIGGRRIFAGIMAFAGIATILTSFARTYPELIVAALGVGLAGGVFSVGVAYISKFYPPRLQGTVLGVFGAGNVGAAATNFLAPFVMIAMGWQAVAQIWGAVLLAASLVFLLLTKEDPGRLERAAHEPGANPIAEQLAVLGNLQVWRFSLYYFFLFGAFVALSLWLPRYLIGVYHLDIRTAGVLAAVYSLPAAVFRIYGGRLSDRYGPRAVMYVTLSVSVLATFMLSYPPTT